MANKKKMIVIDGNSLMFRAYYATAYTGNLMQTRSGIYTNALYGFINMMKHLLSLNCSSNSLPNLDSSIFVAFDKGKKTFRHKLYDNYKGTRSKTPDEFIMQIPFIKEYLDAMNIFHYEVDDYEADDLVGTVATLAKDYECVEIYSGDRDLLQLVGDNRIVCLNKVGITQLDCFDSKNFFEKVGYIPSETPDYKALVGDSSDNLPGIVGVGPKTAVRLINEYHSIENIEAHIDELKGKLKENVELGIENAKKTKYLATIITNVSLPFSIDDCEFKKPDYNKLRTLYEKMEFKSFLKDIPTTEDFTQVSFFSTPSEVVNLPKIEKNENIKNYHIHDIKDLYAILNQANEFCFDVILSQDNYHLASIVGITLATLNDVFYLSLDEFVASNVFSLFKEKEVITIDSKKVFVALSHYGINLPKVAFDISLAGYVVNPSYGSIDLSILYRYFDMDNLPLQSEVYGKKTIYNMENIEVCEKYAMNLAYGAMVIYPRLKKEIHDISCDYLFYEVELPLARTLGIVEGNGFKIDEATLDQVGFDLLKQMNELEKKIYEEAGEEFNISSPKQLGEVLFDKLNLGKGKKNKTGYVTNAEVLEKLSERHIVPSLVLKYRKYSKLYSTYVAGLKDVINKEDGKVHTIFKQNYTLTGRLSSVEPNIQNIPVRTEDGRLIRQAFIPSFKDGLLISADYSQIELRILAHMSNCPSMIHDFQTGVDFHSNTASKIYDLPLNMVTKDMRRIAKAVNFGIIYGMSTWGLSDEIHISPLEAANFIERYFLIYPEVKEFLDKLVSDAKSLGYSKTLYNRRRYINEIKSSNRVLAKFGERTAMNAPIQGTAADIIKIAMNEVQNEIESHGLKACMVAQVHDELIIDTPADEVEIVKKILKEQMTKVAQLKVLLEVDVETGSTWDLK